MDGVCTGVIPRPQQATSDTHTVATLAASGERGNPHTRLPSCTRASNSDPHSSLANSSIQQAARTRQHLPPSAGNVAHGKV